MISIFATTLAILATIIVVLAILAFVIDRSIAAETYRGPVSDHFDGKQFYNIVNGDPLAPAREQQGSLWQWIMNRPPNTWVWRDDSINTIPEERVAGDRIVATFINHASVLVQTQGINILTDPIWSDRASPFAFAGPHRYRKPGIAFEHLPPIDVVIISHNHYDHMDIPTLRRIVERWQPKIYVPLANQSYLTERGIAGVEDMDWWESRNISESVAISAVAAQHFSSRGLSDRNKTLWGGYIVRTPRGHIYFAGDTGYGPFIGEIKKRFPNIVLGFIPIGAFRPEWFMGPVHVSPDEAIRIQTDLGIDTVIGIHFGTFRLADDQQDEPEQRVQRTLDTLSESAPDFRVPKNGEVFTL